MNKNNAKIYVMSKRIPIEELPLTKRVLNALKRVGIKTIQDLNCLSDEDLYILPGISNKSIREIRETLEKHNIKSDEKITIIKNNKNEKKEYKDNTEELSSFNINIVLDDIKYFTENKLDEIERLILYKRFLNSQSLQEIGDFFGLSRERIRQIESKLIRKIRRYLNLKELLQQDIILVDTEELSKEYLLPLETFKKICIKFHKMNVLETQNKILIVKWEKENIEKIKKEIKDFLFKIGLPIEIEEIEEIYNNI